MKKFKNSKTKWGTISSNKAMYKDIVSIADEEKIVVFSLLQMEKIILTLVYVK